MFEVTEDFSWRVREKRARQRITLSNAADQIGITRQTLRVIENGNSQIKRTVYEKVVNWLINEKVNA